MCVCDPTEVEGQQSCPHVDMHGVCMYMYEPLAQESRNDVCYKKQKLKKKFFLWVNELAVIIKVPHGYLQGLHIYNIISTYMNVFEKCKNKPN